MIVNQLEETQMVLSAAQYLDDELVIKKLKWITPEEADELLKRKDNDNVSRFDDSVSTPVDSEEAE